MSEENEWNGKWLYSLWMKPWVRQGALESFSSVEKLFGCFDDWGICCYGCWCPCCLFGSNASRLDGQNGCIMCCIDCNLSMYSLSWVGHLFQRYKLRQRLSLREDTRCSDLPAVMCCAYCALCQEAREMKSRGRLYAVSINVVDDALFLSQVTSWIGIVVEKIMTIEFL